MVIVIKNSSYIKLIQHATTTCDLVLRLIMIQNSMYVFQFIWENLYLLFYLRLLIDTNYKYEPWYLIM